MLWSQRPPNEEGVLSHPLRGFKGWLAVGLGVFCYLHPLPAAEVTYQAPTEYQTAPQPLHEPAFRVASGAKSLVTVKLPAAESARVEDMLVANYRNKRKQNGFNRAFHETLVARVDQAILSSAKGLPANQHVASAGDWLVWSARLDIDQAHAFRFRLDKVDLPAGAKIWVYNEDGHELGPFTEALEFDDTIWLPAIGGPAAYLEVAIPRRSIEAGEPMHFELNEAVELFDLNALKQSELWKSILGQKGWQDCAIDANCVNPAYYSDIEALQDAIAHLTFSEGGSSFICSGGLITDTVAGFIPYLLTANHCFATQSSASSLTAYFDFETSGCGGIATPFPFLLPNQVSGSTLLATNARSDFTLVRLSSSPGGDLVYLGWTSATPAANETLHRVSHPDGTAQKYTTYRFQSSGGFDSCYVRPDFHLSRGIDGSTVGGSSGSPVLNSNSQIVGQLAGSCGGSDYCSYGDYSEADGAFASTFPNVVQWVDPGSWMVDLITINPAASKTNVSAGESFNVSVAVRNQGYRSSTQSFLRFYRSINSTISSGDTEVVGNFVSGIAHDFQVNSTVPFSISEAGTWFVGACVDAVANESNAFNQCSSAVQVNVLTPPDLIVQGQSVSNTSLSTGQNFTISAAVRNQGGTTAAATTLRYYRSINSFISTADTQVGSDSIAALAGGALSNQSHGTSIASAGTYWMGVCVEAVPGESNINNQCSAGVQVSVTSPPDLIVNDVVVSNSTPVVGQSITISASVRNQGSGASPSTTLRYFKSSNQIISTGDQEIGSDPVAVLAAGANSPEQTLFAISSPGVFWVGGCVESVSGESNVNNQCSSAVQVTASTLTDFVFGSGFE